MNKDEQSGFGQGPQPWHDENAPEASPEAKTPKDKENE